MFNKLFLSVMIVTSAFTLVFGQTPQPRVDRQALPDKEFTFFLDGNSYLGVQTTEVTKENFAKLKLREVRGVAVEKVAENSPAAAAGIQAGDVIIRFNGEEVTSSRKLTRLIGEVDPDHQAKITVIRDGSEREVTATLAKRPGFAFGDGNFKFDLPDFKGWHDNMPNFKGHFDNLPNWKGNFDNMQEHFKNLEEHLKNLPNMQDHLKNLPDMKEHFKNLPQGDFQFRFPDGAFKDYTWHSGRQIGVGVTPLTKQLATHFGVTGGVLVEEVRDNSPAAKAGIKAGDIIVEADGKAITGDSDISRIINSKKDGDVQITYVRDGKRQTVTITPEQSKDGVWNFKTSVAPPVLSSPMVAPAPFVYSAPTRVM